MNSQTLNQLASQHVTEVRQEAGSHRRPASAQRERESIRERAGWTLIHAGLKLTGPPAPGKHARPYAAGL